MSQQFRGIWYITEKYPEEWNVGTCAGVRYTENNERNRINVRDWHLVNGRRDEIEGYLSLLESTDKAARFASVLPSRRPGDGPHSKKKFT